MTSSPGGPNESSVRPPGLWLWLRDLQQPEPPSTDSSLYVSSREQEQRPSLDSLGFAAPHAAQAAVRAEAKRFNVLNCGRRFGKTDEAKRLLAEPAINGQRTAYIAPTFAMARQFYREMADQLHGVIARKNENQRLDLIGGGFIDIWSAENGADRIRGQKYHRVVMDECAVIAGLVAIWEKVVRPTLADYQGDAWFLSTPRRGSGFEELYRRADTDPQWMSWTLPTRLNPFIKPEEIEAARAGSSAETFAQEWEASFEASESDLVHPAFHVTRHVRPATVRWADCKWRVVGIDPGGGDPTAIVPIGVTDREHIHQYGEFYQRGGVTIEQIADYLTRLGPVDRIVVGETNGTIIVETLRALGFPAYRAEMARNEGIDVVNWLLERDRLSVAPECRNSIAEFAGYRWSKRRDGETGERYATRTPADHHADAMDARRYAVMAVYRSMGARRGGRGGIEYVAEYAS